LWIPPTNESELPSNYVELYSNHGTLTVEFNVLKTWTEYINRLLGVLVGFSIFLTLVFSIRYWKLNKAVFYFSLLAFVLVLFQGWLGAKVVASNLKPATVTIHMFVAMLIVFTLLYANIIASKNSKNKFLIKYRGILIVLFVLSLAQLLLGTQVRQWVDELLSTGIERSHLIENIKNFKYHVILAYTLLFFQLLIYLLNFKKYKYSMVFILPLLVLFSEYIVGIVLYRYDLMSIAQPVHLLLSTVYLGLIFRFSVISTQSEVPAGV
jgi:cytochrome c oxidase assembly protein subunit 15